MFQFQERLMIEYPVFCLPSEIINSVRKSSANGSHVLFSQVPLLNQPN